MRFKLEAIRAVRFIEEGVEVEVRKFFIGTNRFIGLPCTCSS